MDFIVHCGESLLQIRRINIITYSKPRLQFAAITYVFA